MPFQKVQSPYLKDYDKRLSGVASPSSRHFKAYRSEGGKCLDTRLNGRFYTHKLIGTNLALSIVELINKSNLTALKIIEPFCGDGRLVCWLLEALDASSSCLDIPIEIEVWDNDSEALDAAVENIKIFAQELNGNVTIKSRCIDTFLEADKYFGQYDICITNPPWENLKPDNRELTQLTDEQKEAYIEQIKIRAAMLDKLYPISKPTKKFSGWGTNLSRCGAEISLRLLKPSGIGGVVLPATLFADQVSEPLRRWIFDKHVVENLSYYAAEARLFDGVDQPSITITCTSEKNTISAPKNMCSYDRNLNQKEKIVSNDTWNRIRGNGFSFPPNFHLEPLEIMGVLKKVSKFGELESADKNGLWAGRELDETGRHRFVSSEGETPFIKGRTIKRFGFAEEPQEFLTENAPKIPESINFHRVAWRDVARHSQKRRIHATIIPPGWVTGNSLHVAYFRDGDINRLYALLGVMNSLTFEAMCRAYIATGHVSLGSVRKTPLPDLYETSVVNGLYELTKEACEQNNEASPDLEVLVAKAYGLKEMEFGCLLSVFDKVDDTERETYLSHPLWQD